MSLIFHPSCTGAVTVEPWFTDSALTTLTFTGGAASLSENFVVEDGITLDVDEVTLSAGASLQVYNGTLRLAELNMDPASEVVVVDGSIILETSAGETEVAGTFTLYDAMGSMYIENDTEFSGDTLALVSHIGISDGVTVQVSGSLVLDGCTVNCVDQGGSYFWDVLPGADFKMARTEMEGCFSFLIKNDGTDIQSCTFDGTLIQVLAIASDTKIFHNVFLNSAQVFDAGLDTITNTDGWGNVGALSNAWNQLALEWTTNGLPNGRTLDAEGLFVQPGDSIDARVDLSSLSMPVSGCELLLGYNAGYLTNGILALEMPWEFDIYEDWSLQSGDPLFGQLDAGIGLGLTAPQEGLSSNGSVATVSFETTGKEGETLFYFRPQLDEPWHTRLASDTNGMSGTFLEPFSLNSQLLVVDGTKPEILSFSAFQDQGVAPVDVFAATNVTLEGTVLISLEASDQLSGLIDEPILMLTHQISAAELTPVLIASSNTASSTIYSWAVIMDGATETGVYDVSSIAQDRSGNMAVSAATLELVAPSATVELELQVPLSGSLNRQVTYSALSASMDELIQWQQNEEFINGSVVTELTSLPPDTAFIRVKAEKTLSRVQPVVFNASMHSLVNFTGTSNLLGGDLNEDNKVNVLDYFMVSSFWNTATDTADVDGDGQVNTIDYSVISFNWLLLGE